VVARGDHEKVMVVCGGGGGGVGGAAIRGRASWCNTLKGQFWDS